ncbi:leucine-rich repeat and IQ domain-containing protein 1 isoform X4 [Hypanus sabinus]|uniref:leucine-rich repeat and IQ domain-containing protein 1 isoform X4 n=1 Tax=Hypanus sabinus TaxID=79690 RepID=UPI0028C43AAE|nr:leucine-rich repeat and IQ domain-containing protein 1 isoform X4 [Hypanus sabinus]
MATDLLETASNGADCKGQEIMDEDKLLEEALEAELSKIHIPASETEESEEEELEESEEDTLIESDSDADDFPTSVLCYLDQIKQRGETAEKMILQDLEQLEYVDHSVQNCSESEMLLALASEFGEDHLNMKERILAQIEEEEQKKDVELQKNIDTDVQLKKTDQPLEDKDISDNEDVITYKCKEVEERCQLTLQQWEVEEKRLQKIKLAELMEQREKEKKQVEEEEERAKSRQKQFVENLEKLTVERQEQQAKLEKKIKQNQEALTKELKHHEALIQSLQMKLDEERRIFEEQQDKERKRVEELRYRAATTIQARFRTFLTLKKYFPILKEKQDERKRREDLQLKMAQERKDFEEKIKKKLQEQSRVEQEETKKQEEAERLQREEQKQRRIEYEKKKEQERQRLEKEKQMRVKNLQEEEKQKELQKKKKEEEQKEAEEKLLKEKTNECMEQTEEKTEKKVVLQLLEEVPATSSMKENETFKYNDNVYVHMNENICLPSNTRDNSPINPSKIEGQSTAARASYAKVEKKLPAEEVMESKTANTLTIESNVIVPQNNILQEVIPYTVADTFPGKLSGDSQSVLNNSEDKLRSEAQIAADELIENMDVSFQNAFTRELALPDHLEQKRLHWMKTCIPWSKIFNENKKKKVKQQVKLRSNPVSRLPTLSPEAILRSGVWTSLQQVTTVTLQDLPGCSLSTLSQCPRLKSLILRNCQLETLEGVNDCKGLQYIDVQKNNIKNIHGLELEDLCVLLLSHNQITSLHGLEKCSSLRIFELSYNNITRIGGLESLKKLQRLVVDHNQLISTKGLSETPTLLYLDCSFNHLSSIKGIDNCGLLQTLKLQSNNLSELPRFENHVLLSDLYLDDNSISTLKELSNYWLPMLQHLSVSQNSLTQLTDMSDFQMLQGLNISNNRLSDLNSLLLCLNGCHSLQELTLDENPFQRESGWRCSILKVLPNLQVVDGGRVTSIDDASAERLSKPSAGSFLALCQTQLQEIELLHRRHKTELDRSNLLEIADAYLHHCEELMHLAEECRYAHEYGELCTAEEKEHPNSPVDDEFCFGKQHKNLTINCIKVNSQNTDHVMDCDEVLTPITHIYGKRNQNDYLRTASHDSQDHDPRLFANLKQTSFSLQEFRMRKGQIQPKSNRMASESQNDASLKGRHEQQISEDYIKNYAAIVLQSHWRGYIIRRDIHKYSVLHNAASLIQTAWVDYCNRKKVAFQHSAGKLPEKWKLFDDSDESRNRATIIIQAHWRGCLLRKKLSRALAAVLTEEEDDFEEVNLNEFLFDEATMDKDWIKLDPGVSSQTLPLPKSDLQQKALAHYAPDSPTLPGQPQLAWQGDDMNTVEKIEYPSSSPLQLHSPSRTLSAFSESTSCGKQSFMSEKEEKISLEWGFKYVHTAQLMLKRAQKMKSKKAEAKKLQDPLVRLALFKNKKSKYLPTESSKKIQASVKYFNVPEEFSHQDTTSVELQPTSRELTYQWLHTQIANYEETNPRNKKHHHFLPEMDPEVLNGGRVQLMASPIGREIPDLGLLSVTSGNAITRQDNRVEVSHWHSSGSAKATVPPKTGSKRLKHERISFRDNQVRLSTGWGTGKRREKSS